MTISIEQFGDILEGYARLERCDVANLKITLQVDFDDPQTMWEVLDFFGVAEQFVDPRSVK